MELKEGQLTEIFKEVIQDKQVKQAIEIVRKNSQGRIWIIGGFVYKSLAKKLYGKPEAQSKDYDFIVEQPNPRIELPDGWVLTRNRFGNSKFVGDFQIDFVPLRMVYSILRGKIPATIENYLNGVPLNVQSIAYDANEERVIGEVGISALESRVVAVHDLKIAEDVVRLFYPEKLKDVNEMIRKKAEELGFDVLYV